MPQTCWSTNHSNHAKLIEAYAVDRLKDFIKTSMPFILEQMTKEREKEREKIIGDRRYMGI